MGIQNTTKYKKVVKNGLKQAQKRLNQEIDTFFRNLEKLTDERTKINMLIKFNNSYIKYLKQYLKELKGGEK